MGLTHSPLPTNFPVPGSPMGTQCVYCSHGMGGEAAGGEGLGVPVPQRSSGKVLDGNF